MLYQRVQTMKIMLKLGFALFDIIMPTRV